MCVVRRLQIAKLANVYYEDEEKVNECAHDMKPSDRSGGTGSPPMCHCTVCVPSRSLSICKLSVVVSILFINKFSGIQRCLCVIIQAHGTTMLEPAPLARMSKPSRPRCMPWQTLRSTPGSSTSASPIPRGMAATGSPSPQTTSRRCHTRALVRGPVGLVAQRLPGSFWMPE